jgi:hypothetical protein
MHSFSFARKYLHVGGGGSEAPHLRRQGYRNFETSDKIGKSGRPRLPRGAAKGRIVPRLIYCLRCEGYGGVGNPQHRQLPSGQISSRFVQFSDLAIRH